MSATGKTDARLRTDIKEKLTTLKTDYAILRKLIQIIDLNLKANNSAQEGEIKTQKYESLLESLENAKEVQAAITKYSNLELQRLTQK